MKVSKTIKLFIGGAFPRTESGRSFTHSDYRLCQASRKDFRNAVDAAKKGHAIWSKRSGYNRSQILYRMAEMTEGKRGEFSQLFQDVLGVDSKQANQMVDEGIDTFVYYAGFCDKYQQLSGAMNPINGPFHNFTTPDAMGVVALVEPDKFSFSKLIDDLCSILVGGNSAVVLLSKECPAVLAPLAEVFATSDLPAGVINLLTGHLEELHSFIGSHREVRAINYQNENSKFLHEMKLEGVENMKRVVGPKSHGQSLDLIYNFIEQKTIWHPEGY